MTTPDSTRENEAPNEPLAGPTAAMPRIGASLDLETELREVTQSARAPTGARYGAIVTIDEKGGAPGFRDPRSHRRRAPRADGVVRRAAAARADRSTRTASSNPPDPRDRTSTPAVLTGWVHKDDTRDVHRGRTGTVRRQHAGSTTAILPLSCSSNAFQYGRGPYTGWPKGFAEGVARRPTRASGDAPRRMTLRQSDLPGTGAEA